MDKVAADAMAKAFAAQAEVIEDLRAALAAAEAKAEVASLLPSWHPIKTAPVGVWILAIIGKNHAPCVPFTPMVVKRKNGAGRPTFVNDSGDVNEGWHPTHWMPLPTPPQGGSYYE